MERSSEKRTTLPVRTGVLFGLIYPSHQIGAAMGAFLGGWGYDQFGMHGFAFGIAAVLLFAGATLSRLIPEHAPRWRRVSQKVPTNPT